MSTEAGSSGDSSTSTINDANKKLLTKIDAEVLEAFKLFDKVGTLYEIVFLKCRF